MENFTTNVVLGIAGNTAARMKKQLVIDTDAVEVLVAIANEPKSVAEGINAIQLAVESLETDEPSFVGSLNNK